MGSTPTRSQFFPLFFFPYFFPSLHFLFSSPFFFCPPLISSSPFPLPSFFLLFFPIPFLSFSSSCYLFSYLSAAFLSLFPPFFIVLISSSFSPPLSFSLFCFLLFFFLALNFLSCFTSLPSYEHKGNNNKRLVVPNISPTSLP